MIPMQTVTMGHGSDLPVPSSCECRLGLHAVWELVEADSGCDGGQAGKALCLLLTDADACVTVLPLGCFGFARW